MVDQMDAPSTAPEGTPDRDADASSGWSSAGDDRQQKWLAQLQAMIDGVAVAAAPHVREIAAKAAELAAKAGDAAGPLAQRAAGVTSDVGHRVAARSRDIAADLRRPGDTNGHPGETTQIGTADLAGGSGPESHETTGEG